MAPICPQNGRACLQLQINDGREGWGLRGQGCASAELSLLEWEGQEGSHSQKKTVGAAHLPAQGFWVGSQGRLGLLEAGGARAARGNFLHSAGTNRSFISLNLKFKRGSGLGDHL